MENNEIHKNLPEKELRDFLGKQLELYEVYDSVEVAEKKLKDAKDHLERAKIFHALETIIALKGWQDIDCSDEIGDYFDIGYFPFIGTDEEFKKIFGET